MSQLSYLDLSGLCHSDRAMDEPERQLSELPEGLESVPELQAAAEELALQPVSSKAYRLAERIYGALKAHQQQYLRPPSGFPLPQAEREQAQVYTSAWQALGRTYAHWCFAQEHPTEAGLLVGAIACLGQIVRLFGFYHRCMPEGLWLDLHALLQLAQQAKLARTKSKWSLLQRAYTTPEWEYFKALLLGLADPYGLLPQEVTLLDSLLEKWVVMVKTTDDPAEGWYIDRDADTPATWWAAGHGPRLDLTELAALFASHRHWAAPVGRFESWHQPPDTIPVGLLERLECCWFQPPVEPTGFPSMDSEWVIGLEHIFARLQGKATEAIPAVIDAGRADVADARPESLQVGDLVGVFAPDGGDLISLAGVDRLLWSESVPRLHVQLKQMQGEVFAVGLQPFYRARQPCAYQRGLLLAEADRLSLLLAEQPLQEGLVVRLLHGSKLYPVRLDSRQNPARGILSCRCVSAADLVQK